jgi:hypothetical protein
MELLFQTVLRREYGRATGFDIFLVDSGVYFAFSAVDFDYYGKIKTTEFYISKVKGRWQSEPFDCAVEELGKEIEEYLFEERFKKNYKPKQ